MATEKIYYLDQYIRSFKANLQETGKDENGRYYVVLDQTAFYPTGGGQPHDTGTLNGIEVNDVEEVEGEIRHYLDQPLVEGQECVGEIDWERRFDHMQQHAGQHILSAVFEQQFDYQTVSFHLGKEVCTIDLETAALSEEEANQAENTANNIILENRPIEAKWVTEEELSNYTLRKALSVVENIRLVIIPDFDYNGCGGTHPSSTGQVNGIKILDWEKQKKNIRVSFVCGNRVRKQLHEKQKVVKSLSAILSASQEQLTDAAARLIQQNKDLEKSVDDLKTKLLEYEADNFIKDAQLTVNCKLVKINFKNRPMGEIQQLAKMIASRTTDMIVLIINEDENNQKLQFVFSRSQDLNMNMNDLLKRVLPMVNGKGGGSAHTAQGGGEQIVSPEELMEVLISHINTCMNC